MPVDVFSYRVNDNVCTVVQGILDVGAEKRVVNNDHNTMLVGNGSDVPDINQAQSRVTRRFNPDEFRLVGPDHVGDIKLDAWRKRHLHAVRRGHLGEVTVSAPVDVRD